METGRQDADRRGEWFRDESGRVEEGGRSWGEGGREWKRKNRRTRKDMG